MKRKISKISIGIVTHNSSDDIEKCLKSFIEFTDNNKTDIKLFIYDNNSSDFPNTKLIAKKYFKDAIIIESSKNMGFGYGHNEIIKQINSDYHLILNPDIEFTENTLTKLSEYMELNHDVVLITPEIRNTDGTVQHLPKIFPKLRYVMSSTVPFFKKYRTNYTMSQKTIKKPINIEICTGCFMFARTESLKKINGFDDSFFLYFEDFDLSMRIRKLGRIVYYPLTKVTHVWHRDTKKKIKPSLIQIHSMLRFYTKHLWRHK